MKTQKHADDSTTPEGQWRRLARRWSIRDQGPTTICFAYLCRYAEGCPNRTQHPRRVPQHRCPRYWPEGHRPPARLSAYLLNLLERSAP